MSERQTELRVELQGDEEPISGHLTDGQGSRIAFAGWTQLVSLIDRAWGRRDRAGAESEPQPDQPQRRNT